MPKNGVEKGGMREKSVGTTGLDLLSQIIWKELY